MARCFHPRSPPPLTPDPHEELLASLSRLTSLNPPVHTCSTGWTFHGFYAGPTSIAFLFYRLSHFYPELQFKSQSLLDWALAYLKLGSHYLTPKRPTVDPSHCGVANETLCQIALTSLLTNDSSLARQLCSYSSVINLADDEGSNEWLYGRAGYLYLLRLLLRLTPTAVTLTKQLQDTVVGTINRILACPFPWKWHHKPYLGAVHGSIGIVVQILLSSPSSHIQQFSQQLGPVLRSILDEQLPSGNFPSLHSVQSRKQAIDYDDRLVQFCHGSPGVILSILSIWPFYKNGAELSVRINNAISKSQADLLERGLLTKTPCLCHGIPSNTLALVYDEKMLEYLSYMSTANLEGELGQRLGWMSEAGHSDHYAGLYTGEAGRAWVWALADTTRKSTNEEGSAESARKLIGFNDV